MTMAPSRAASTGIPSCVRVVVRRSMLLAVDVGLELGMVVGLGAVAEEKGIQSLV